MMTKDILKSRVFWLNVVGLLIAILTIVVGPEFGLSDKLIGVVNGLIAMANIFLRFLTSLPITPLFSEPSTNPDDLAKPPQS